MAGTRGATLGLVLLLAVLGGDLWVSYSRVEPVPAVRALTLTPHDHLVAAYRGKQGDDWVAGLYGLIAHRAPGAADWQVVSSGTNNALLAISFASDNLHGFAVGGGGTIVATADGGKSWRLQNSGTLQQLLDVYAADALHVCAVGAFGTVTLTSDGGETWHTAKIPWDQLLPRITKEYGTIEPALNSVYCSSPRVGFAAGEFGTIIRTTDGGATWQAQTYGTLDTPQLVGIAFLGDRAGWAVAQDGSIVDTTDAGESWSKAASGGVDDSLLAIRLGGQERTLQALTVGKDGPILRVEEQHRS